LFQLDWNILLEHCNLSSVLGVVPPSARLSSLYFAIAGTEHSEPTSGYRFKLIMAGYDADGSSWMGTFSLDASPDTTMSGRDFRRIKETSMTVEPIGSAVMFMTGGIDVIASDFFSWNDLFQRLMLAAAAST
jgi:hypothetical protein